MEMHGIELTTKPEAGVYDLVVVAVAHSEFKALGGDSIRAFGKPGSLVYDVKYVLPANESDDRL